MENKLRRAMILVGNDETGPHLPAMLHAALPYRDWERATTHASEGRWGRCWLQHLGASFLRVLSSLPCHPSSLQNIRQIPVLFFLAAQFQEAASIFRLIRLFLLNEHHTIARHSTPVASLRPRLSTTFIRPLHTSNPSSRAPINRGTLFLSPAKPHLKRTGQTQMLQA